MEDSRNSWGPDIVQMYGGPKTVLGTYKDLGKIRKGDNGKRRDGQGTVQ